MDKKIEELAKEYADKLPSKGLLYNLDIQKAYIKGSELNNELLKNMADFIQLAVSINECNDILIPSNIEYGKMLLHLYKKQLTNKG